MAGELDTGQRWPWASLTPRLGQGRAGVLFLSWGRCRTGVTVSKVTCTQELKRK